MSSRPARSVAEWVTLAGSCAVLAVVVVLIGFQMREPRDPAAPVAVVNEEVRQIGAHHHVDVKVTNTGDATAVNVIVTAELEIDGKTVSGDQTIDFLAGGEEDDLVFIFDDDPDGGELTVRVAGFSVP